MNHQEILSKLQQILFQVCGPHAAITPHTHLYEDLDLDSVGLLALATEVEQEFQIPLAVSDQGTFPLTIEELMALISTELRA